MTPVIPTKILLALAVAGVAVVLLAALVVWRANRGRPKRCTQVLLPVVAVVYCLFALVTANQQMAAIAAGINALSSRFDALGGVASLISRFVDTANLESVLVAVVTLASVCIANVTILLGFAAIKGIYHMVVSLVVKKAAPLCKTLVMDFYEYDENYGHWYIREDRVGLRRVMKWLYRTALVLCSVLFFLSILGIGATLTVGPLVAWLKPLVANPFYPAFAVLLVGECYFFLDGVTRQEYLDGIEVEDDHARRIFQYAKVRTALEHYFGDRLLKAASRGKRKAGYLSHEDFCKDLSASQDFETKEAGAYFKALTSQNLIGRGSVSGYDELNHDDALSTVDLLKGRSVMFASPFYRDFIPYVFLPLNAQLIRGRRALVLYGANCSAEEMNSYVREGLDFVTNADDLYRIGPWEEEPDVALVPFFELGSPDDVSRHAALLEKVGFVVIVDPSSLLATYQVGLSFLAEHLGRGCAVTYCIFDKNSDGLVDSLSHALRANLVEVNATEYAEGAAVGMFWQVDGEFLQHRLFPNVAHYLGASAEVGLVALKRQVERVSWVSAEAVPLVDQRWILGQYHGELFRFAELPQEQNQIDEHFRFQYDPWSMPKQDHQFIMVEDEYANLFEAYRQYATRGIDDAFINVMSPNYLLREYMVDLADVLLIDPKAIPSLAPDFSKSARNLIFGIVMMMVDLPAGAIGVPEEEIVARLKYAGVLDNRSVFETLQGLIVDHIAVDDEAVRAAAGNAAASVSRAAAATKAGAKALMPEDHLVMEEVQEYVPALRDVATRYYYRFDSKVAAEPWFRTLRNVPMVTEMPDGTEEYLGSRLYCHVYKTLLPGQFVTLKGKYYEVLQISDTTGVLLRRAADHFSRRRYYRQLRTYRVDRWQDGEAPGDAYSIGGGGVIRGYAKFSVRTEGYLDMEDYGNLYSAKRVSLTNVPDREYTHKSVLKVVLSGATPQVATTLTLLISEMLKTLYPRDHMFLAVLQGQGESLPEGMLYPCEFSWDGAQVSVGAGEYAVDAGAPYILIIEDSLIDIGLLSSVERNLSRILEMCWDWLDWHVAKMEGRTDEAPTYDVSVVPPNPEPIPEKKSIFKRAIEWIKGVPGKIKGLGKGKKPQVDGGEKPEREGSPEADAGVTADIPESGSETAPEPDAPASVDDGIEPERDVEPESDAEPEPDAAPEPDDSTPQDTSSLQGASTSEENEGQHA